MSLRILYESRTAGGIVTIDTRLRSVKNAGGPPIVGAVQINCSQA